MTSKNHIDWYILLTVVALLLLSIAFVYSASAAYATQLGSQTKLFLSHSVRVVLGFGALLIFAKLDYHLLQKVSKYLLMFGIILLVAVLIIGASEKGAVRWIDLGFFRFQPSEFVKLALVIHLAVLLEKKSEYINDFKRGMLPLLFWSGTVAVLIILQPNLSTTIIIFVISLVMMFVGNTRLLHLFSIAGVGFGLSSLLVLLKSDYRLNRILAFIGNPNEIESLESLSYQLKQSLIALGNGGISGLGPGASRQSDLFLPESYGDFIFSIIGEEYGFLGTFFLISLFVVFLWRGLIVAKHAPDNFGYYLSIGITVTICLSAFINAGVNTGLLPTTGLPMPFISYGGTAILFYSAAVGILLNISSQAGVFQRNNTILR